MAWKLQGHASLLQWLVLSLHILSLMNAVHAKSGRTITDAEIRMKKDECYADIESGMWGWDCKLSMIAKENCALKCLSPRCYELVYGSDPLEEGEKDIIRSQEFKFCQYRSKSDAYLDDTQMLRFKQQASNNFDDCYPKQIIKWREPRWH